MALAEYGMFYVMYIISFFEQNNDKKYLYEFFVCSRDKELNRDMPLILCICSLSERIH